MTRVTTERKRGTADGEDRMAGRVSNRAAGSGPCCVNTAKFSPSMASPASGAEKVGPIDTRDATRDSIVKPNKQLR